MSQPNEAVGRKIDDAMHEGRRRDLATAALQTWSEHGYAQVSVRNVARRTRFSHGMVHYYFHSKDALVGECVKLICEAQIFSACDVVATDITSYSQQVAESISESFRVNRRFHRIRFDLLNQSLFEPSLRPHAADLDRVYAACRERLHQSYVALGWEFDPPFELLAQHIDALVARAVRDEILHGDLPSTTARLREELHHILPKDS